MNFDFSNSEEILDAAKTENLYRKLVIQLRKDFGLANIEIQISNAQDSRGLQSLIREKIYYLILEKFDAYLHLLYIIDVPESAFKNIHLTDVVEVSEQMTFSILKRELQKVWFKKKYTPRNIP